MSTTSKGLYLTRFGQYLLAAPYNLQPDNGNVVAYARHWLAWHGLKDDTLFSWDRGDIGRFKTVKGYKIVHEIGQFEDKN